MKIVFITTALTTGGAEMMLYKLLQKIDRSIFKPYVISLRTMGEVGPRIHALGIPVLALDMNPRLPNPLKILKLINSLRKLNPDLVQTWMYHADLLGGIAARIAGCRKVIWNLRNSNLDPSLTKRSTLMVVKFCAALSCWLPSMILTCSSRAKVVHEAVGYVSEKIHVIPNGFDLGRFFPDNSARLEVRSELNLPIATPLLGLMARYDPQKNHDGFIAAAALIHQQIPGVHFLLAGGGIDDNNPALKMAIQERGLAPNMHLLGRRNDMPRLMASLDVLVSSSTGEAFPNVLGEAMACGVPCVVTDVGDSAEIVGDTGRVVPPGDMKVLAQNVVTLLRLPQEEKSLLRKRARERVEQCYEISLVAKRYESFYEELLQTKLQEAN